MKYVSLTFDDGRRDNYTYAYPIMRKRNLPGTLFCTTGYIDGTWKKPAAWASAGEAITVEQLKEMQEAGWEIALHGDKHTTDVDDFRVASGKTLKWGFTKRPIGFSIPNSSVAQETLNALADAYLGPELAYIRAGRAIDTKSLTA
jgi:peptidoglycan/xylan/chitin deacetylase (PgdA/CDA1 family)